MLKVKWNEKQTLRFQKTLFAAYFLTNAPLLLTEHRWFGPFRAITLVCLTVLKLRLTVVTSICLPPVLVYKGVLKKRPQHRKVTGFWWIQFLFGSVSSLMWGDSSWKQSLLPVTCSSNHRAWHIYSSTHKNVKKKNRLSTRKKVALF